MTSLIFLIIFFISLIMVSMIILKKIPVLVLLSSEEFQRQGIFSRLKSKIRVGKLTKAISSKEILLHRALSRFRILTLKTEKKTGTLLSKLRQKSIERKERKDFEKDYWRNLRNKK